MEKVFNKLIAGYHKFRDKYAAGHDSVMRELSYQGQNPRVMVIACSDSRVDPALILQCEPGDLFVVRNVASIVPPYEKDSGYHGTSAALEFAVRFLKVDHIVILGHSQCGGIDALMQGDNFPKTDFIETWVSVVKSECSGFGGVDNYVKKSLERSEKNCMTFPWISDRVQKGDLKIHRWFFEIKKGKLYGYSVKNSSYELL